MTVLVGAPFTGAATDWVASSSPAAWNYVATASGQAAIMKFNPKIRNPATATMYLGVYADSGGIPSSLIWSGQVLHPLDGEGPYLAVISPTLTITTGVKYHLAMLQIGETQFDFLGDSLAAAYNEGATGQSVLPASFGTPAGAFNIQASLWLEDAAGLPPVHQIGDSAPKTLTLPARMRAR